MEFERKIFVVTDAEHRTRRLPTGNDVVRRSLCPSEMLEEHLIERDSALPLRFFGRLIGANSVDVELPRGTEVRIFATRAGQIVTAVRQWQRGRGAPRQRCAASHHRTPKEALAWLIEDGRGRLGTASREAWRRACEAWPALQGHAVEEIE